MVVVVRGWSVMVVVVRGWSVMVVVVREVVSYGRCGEKSSQLWRLR